MGKLDPLVENESTKLKSSNYRFAFSDMGSDKLWNIEANCFIWRLVKNDLSKAWHVDHFFRSVLNYFSNLLSSFLPPHVS